MVFKLNVYPKNTLSHRPLVLAPPSFHGFDPPAATLLPFAYRLTAKELRVVHALTSRDSNGRFDVRDFIRFVTRSPASARPLVAVAAKIEVKDGTGGIARVKALLGGMSPAELARP